MQTTMKTDVRRYQAVVVAQALELYAKKGIRANTAYTPSAMMATAYRILGQTQPRRDYLGTARRLREWAMAE